MSLTAFKSYLKKKFFVNKSHTFSMQKCLLPSLKACFASMLLLCSSCAAINRKDRTTAPIKVEAINPHTGKKDVFTYGSQVMERYGYAAVLDSLTHLSKEYDTPESSDQDKSIYHQAMMTFYSFCGHHRACLAAETEAFGQKWPDTFIPEGPWAAVDAANYIVDTYGHERLILFNEAHSRGQHRAFLRSMLPAFYQKGFRYLALETIDHKDSLLMQRGFPTQKSGFYVKEPAFGQLVRDAISLGFNIVAYETTAGFDPNVSALEQRNRRELDQADNLLKVFSLDPNAKILVWAGHGHIHKKSDTEWKFMAEHLCKRLAHDVPSIECTMMQEGAEKRNEAKMYQFATDSFKQARPFILLHSDKPYVAPQLAEKVNLNVFFPRTDLTEGYPDWMKESAETKYRLRMKNNPDLSQKMLQVYKANEWQAVGKDAIPVLVIILPEMSASIDLYLKKGKYHAFVFENYAKPLFHKKFTVR